MRRIVVLAILLGLMRLLQTFQIGTETAFHPLSLATFGFVLMAAYTLGQVATGVQLPKITGYIITGLVFGPQVLNVFSSGVEADLRVVNDLAIGLIALSAGAEMHIAGLRKIARSLFWIVAVKGLLILVLVTATVFALSSYLPFLSGQPTGLILSVGMILGVLAIGTSPAATIAVISETGAKGRLADTTLGVAVAKDIVMVVLLALAIALTKTFSPDGHGFEVAILRDLALELGLSLIAGALLGGLIIAYIKYLGGELWLFVVGVVFAITATAQQFHLEALLVFIIAGFVVQNVSKLGHDFIHLVEKVALPVYVVFFSVAGAGLDLAGLRSVLPIALALVAVRLFAIYAGTGLATKIAGEPDAVRKNAWMAFVAQAGVVIGLLIIVENNLPGLGSEIRTLVMGTVAIHLLLGPILFKWALTRAGEVATAESTLASVEIRGEAELTRLPAEIEQPIAALERHLRLSVAPLTTACVEGPIALAGAVATWPDTPERSALDVRVSAYSVRPLDIALNRLWSQAHRAALEVPRQVSVPLEDHWYRPTATDSWLDRWLKVGRRVRRTLGRLSGGKSALYRVAPIRHMALYHIDGALTEDLVPVLALISAQPALALQEGLGMMVPVRGEDDEEDDADEGRAAPRRLSQDEAASLLDKAVSGRFATMREELCRVGTVGLPAWKRRPSALHERARHARQRTSEKIDAWQVYARSVVDYQRRLDASGDLRDGFGADARVFIKHLNARFDATIAAPVERASAVLASARERVKSAHEMDAEAVEALLTEIGEEVSQGLRRRTLATLRRGLDTQPIDRELTAFARTVDVRLEHLPGSFRVVDPSQLPHPEEPWRSYPDITDHQFQLIATGAVERTIQPTLAVVRKQAQAALEHAEEVVNELRQALERRFDAAIDAVIEEGDGNAPRPRHADPVSRSIEIAESALESAQARLSTLSERTREAREKIATTLREDFEALVTRLDSQLASAGRLEARFQAGRAMLERQGTAAIRLFVRRLRRDGRALLERFGLVRNDEREDRDVHFRPAGRAGSDRAVLFDILFNETTLSGKIFDGALILSILASIVVLMLESVEPFRQQHGTSLWLLEWFFTLLFTAEYAARLWTVARPANYAFSFFGLIDFVAVLPTYLSLLVPGGQFLMVIRVLRVARAFRVLKLARYMGEAQVLVDALKASQYKITVFLVYVLSVAVVMGSAMYLIEGPAAGFTSIPRGVYWSIVTLTTVGFGDITPQTPLGQTLAALLMIMGYGIIAVPTGIITAQIATARPRSGNAQTCAACGEEELESTAAFCRTCGTRFTL